MGGKKREGLQERTHGQNQSQVGSRVGGGDGWGGGSGGEKMETTVLEQQFFKNLASNLFSTLHGQVN